MDPDIYTQVKIRIKKVLSIDLNYYKDEQMKRRLDSWLARSVVSTWNDYFHLVSSNAEELNRFRNYLTINVTEFFRDAERWQMLRQTLMPGLLNAAYGQNGHGTLRVWSAGCSIGIEAYTLAILLDEVAYNRPYSILATDLDRGALQVARARGPYKAEETKNLSAKQLARCLDFQPGIGYFAKSFLARPIQFTEQDLNADRFDTGFDLIVCRNVIIYFTNEAKLHLYQKFHDALRPGGVLFLGGTEIIPSPKEIGFRNQGYAFYTKGT
jgi:chemotaxis protein methyltransferase CheR